MYKILIRNPDGTLHKSKTYETDKSFLKWWAEHTKRYVWCGMTIVPFKHSRFGNWRKLTVADVLRIEEKRNVEGKRKAKEGKEKA